MPVRYRGVHLGDLETFEEKDWRNRERPPSEADWRAIRCHAAHKLLYEALEKHPITEHPSAPDVPWIVVVLREVCSAAMDGTRDEAFEEEVLRLYVLRYGMGQILKIWGVDVGRLMAGIERMMEEGGEG